MNDPVDTRESRKRSRDKQENENHTAKKRRIGGVENGNNRNINASEQPFHLKVPMMVKYKLANANNNRTPYWTKLETDLINITNQLFKSNIHVNDLRNSNNNANQQQQFNFDAYYNGTGNKSHFCLTYLLQIFGTVELDFHNDIKTINNR